MEIKKKRTKYNTIFIIIFNFLVDIMILKIRNENSNIERVKCDRHFPQYLKEKKSYD